MQFKKLVVTTDLSANANAVHPLAASLARAFNGEITIVHVVEDVSFYAVAEGITTDVAEWITEIHQVRQRELNKLVEEFSAREKVKATAVLLRGNTVSEIIKYLNESQVDCVVIATHGRTGLSHLLLGSIAERVVRLAPCPVLSVRPKLE